MDKNSVKYISITLKNPETRVFYYAITHLRKVVSYGKKYRNKYVMADIWKAINR